MNQLEIKILIEEDFLEKFSDILEKLNSEGFEERSTFKEIGLIFGVIPSKQFESLGEIEGVLKVSAEQVLGTFPSSDGMRSSSKDYKIENIKSEEE